MKEFNNLSENEKDSIRDVIYDCLGDYTYFCTRVWEAWSYGTMSEDDFVCAREDNDFIDEIAINIYNKINQINNYREKKE